MIFLPLTAWFMLKPLSIHAREIYPVLCCVETSQLRG